MGRGRGHSRGITAAIGNNSLSARLNTAHYSGRVTLLNQRVRGYPIPKAAGAGLWGRGGPAAGWNKVLPPHTAIATNTPRSESYTEANSSRPQQL